MFGFCVYIVLLLGALGYSSDDELCNYVYTNQCQEHTDTYFLTNYTLRPRKLCASSHVPNTINYTVMLNDANLLSKSGLMKVEFPSPDAECTYKVTLLQIPLGDDQSHCEDQPNATNRFNTANVHTVEKSICVVAQPNNLATYNKSTNSSLPCQRNIVLWFRYIFTGCYALRFYTDSGEYVYSRPKFLKSNYQRSAVAKPILRCNYDVVSDESTSVERVVFETDLLVDPNVAALSLSLATVSESHKNNKKACILYSHPPMYTWNVNLISNQSDKWNCTISSENATEVGNENRKIGCKLEMETSGRAGHCFTVRFIDERCHKQTLWNPHLDGKLPCAWASSCTRVAGSQRKVGYTVLPKERDASIVPSILLPMVVIGLSVMSVMGLAWFMRLNRERKIQLPLSRMSVNGQAISESTKLDERAMPRLNDETEGEDEPAATGKDVILVYTKGPAAFMALMKEFSAMIGKRCGCTVHDWYAANQWNNVAKIGATEWFAELLKNGCRVVWIDTPIARALVPSKFNNNVYVKSRSKREERYEVEIGDFRDAEFPAVLDLAKCDVKHLTSQYHRHFIVRLKGFEASKGCHDPFVDLSPYARYLIPQHLGQLCSHLSTSKLGTSFKDTKVDEDLLEEHLSRLKLNFLK